VLVTQVIAVAAVLQPQFKQLPVAVVAVPQMAAALSAAGSSAVELLEPMDRSRAVQVAALRFRTLSEPSWFRLKSLKSDPYPRLSTALKSVSVATT
jgi:hypothetical protein